mgnify:CR=1 FL=1
MWKINLLNFIDHSCILIVNDVELTLSELIPKYPLHSTRIIKNEEKDTYMRFEETHIQKAHDPLKLTRFLEDIGFKNINVYSDFDISPGYNDECQ